MRFQRLGAACTAGVGLAALLLAGCGPAVGSLSGKVTVDGSPLKGGNITFVNDSGGASASAEISETGTYTIQNIAAGEYTITVNTEYLKAGSSGGGGKPGGGGGTPPIPAPGGSGSGKPGGSGGAPPPPGGGSGGGAPPKGVGGAPKSEMPGNPADFGYNPSAPGAAASRYMKIASKYADASQSDLTFTHPGGAATHDLPLSSK